MQSVVIDGLLLIAQDRSFAFRTAAIHRLGECGPMASNAVPFLVKTLAGPFTSARSSTIWALGQIRSQPELVVPALTNLLSDPDPATQAAAASALRAFGYDVPVPWQAQPVPRLMHPPPPVRAKERYF
jgi:HEAT repeat protein